MKPRKLLLALPFLLLGAGYFTTFSQLEVHPIIEVQLFLFPIQLGLVAYFLLWRRPSEQAVAHTLETVQKHGADQTGLDQAGVDQDAASQDAANPRGKSPDDL